VAQHHAHGNFDVTGSHSGKRYRIRHGVGINVFELDSSGRQLTGWCFVPKEDLIAGDVMPAQKIALEANERTALLVAKNFPPRWRAHPSDRLDKVTGFRKLNINARGCAGTKCCAEPEAARQASLPCPPAFSSQLPMTSASKKNVMPARRPFVP
jgi:hypothetical protein